MSKTIEIELPKGFMNVAISADCKTLTADTNNSANWDTLKFPLPKGRWSIKGYTTTIADEKSKLHLIDKRNWFLRFFGL